MKKIYYLIIAFALTMVSTNLKSQTATMPSGSGTSGDPYQIATLDNLYWLSQADTAWSRYYIQTADIDASASSTWNVGDHDGDGGTPDKAMGFSPIGNNTTYFTGSYNGKGHIIKNLYINRPTAEYIGLFGYIKNTIPYSNFKRIDSIGVMNVDITGYRFTGGLVGCVYYPLISSCFSTGKITGIDDNIGGLVGTTSGSTYTGDSIYNCYSTASVSGDRYIGGLIGLNFYITVKNCYSSGAVVSAASISYQGGLIGYGWNPEYITNSFWDTEASGLSTTNVGGTGIATIQMKDISSFTDLESKGLDQAWDFSGTFNNDTLTSEIWAFGTGNNGYPMLAWQDSVLASVTSNSISGIDATSVDGNGTIEFLSSSIPSQYGFCWNTTGTPTTSDSKTSEGTASSPGAFISDISGLTQGTTYYTRAYITNTFGTAYGEEIVFIAGGTYSTTDSIVNITETSATVYGNLTELGTTSATAHGFCWNTTGNPTIADNSVDNGSTSTLGSFSANISGLASGQDYYVRSYATNSNGTVYGNEISFAVVVKPSGSGTALAPYRISSLGKLRYLMNDTTIWDCYFIQTTDIDASITSTWNPKSTGGYYGLFPIGNDEMKFTGEYKGNNYTIDGLYINQSNEEYMGMFGQTNGANITDLNLTNVEVYGKSNSGGLIGRAAYTSLENCYTSGTVSGENGNIGGIAGIFVYGTIISCHGNATVSGGAFNVGGLVGALTGSPMSFSYFEGNTSSTSYYVAGLIGASSSSTISYCYNAGNISNNTFYAGGLIGRLNSDTVINCYNTGNVDGGKNAAGVVSYLSGGIVNFCYSIGKITGTNANGLIGIEYGPGVVVNSFWDTETSGVSTSTSGTGKTTAEMKNIATYTNISTDGLDNAWDFMATIGSDESNSDFWMFGGNKEYPKLYWQDSLYAAVESNNIANLSATSATANGEIVYLGSSNPTQYGFCWNTSGNPTTSDNKTTEGTASATGTFSSSLTSLTISTTYYARSYITNEFGTFYGNEIHFTTGQAYVTTDSITDITDNTVKAHGNITSLGLTNPTAHGFCWNTAGNPSVPSVDSYNIGSKTSTGEFQYTITGLEIGGTYYVKAYATNSEGTVYGDEIMFVVAPVPSGSGTESDPYLIESLGHLKWLSENDYAWNKYFKQTANIDASATSTWDSDGSGGYYGFSPIGNDNKNFTGTYKGSGYTIDGLYINRPSTYYIGFFGYINGARIDSLGLTNIDIVGDYYTGGFVGYAFNHSSITHSYVKGSLTGNSYIGGFAGFAKNNSAFYYCYSDVNTNGYEYTGGFLGKGDYNYSEIRNCYSKGSVTGSGWYAGGFVGMNNYTIINYCYSTGVVAGGNPMGFASYNAGYTLTTNYYNTDSTSTDSYATGLTDSEMKSACTFEDAGWDFMIETANGTDDIWGRNDAENNGFPFLEYQGYAHTNGCTPITQASSIVVTEGTYTADLSWTSGSGESRAVFMIQASTGSPTVANKTTYSANAAFGSGTQAGTGWYCVYNGSGSSVTVSNLTPGTSYRIAILDYNNGAGDERYNISSATNNPNNFTQNKLDQTITFNSLAAKTYGDASFTAGGSASSGLTVTYSSSDNNVATISGDLIEIVGAGTCDIFADQAGSGTYNAAPQVSQSLTVNAKTLTISGVTIDPKTYDATNSVALNNSSASLNGIVNSDDVAIDASSALATYDNKNVGTDKTVTAINYALSGNDADNYSLTQPTGLTGEITQAELTITGTVNVTSKTYDGNTDAVLTGGSLSGILLTDVVSINTRVGTFADKNIGTGKSVTVAITTTGTDAGNYSLTQPTGLTGNILAKTITISSPAVTTKTYDASTDATITGTLSGTVLTDNVVLVGTGTFASANVGTGINVTASCSLSGTDAGNYTLTQPTGLTGNITAKELTIGGTFTVSNKNYNSFVVATEATNSLSLIGVETGDNVALANEVFEFNDGNAGDDKTVSITSAEISGTDMANYTLSLTGAPTTTANILARELTIGGSFTVNNKTYNANVDATIANNNLSLTNSIAGDDVALANEVITFADKNMATGKTVSITSAVLSGSDADNYTLSLTGAPTATANITAKELTISGLTSTNKVYDGIITTTLSGTASLDGTINGDDISVDESSASATFADASVGNTKTVTVTGYTLYGADAGNYALTQPSGFTADITAKELTISGISTDNKMYDGTTNASISGTLALNGAVSGDDVSVSGGTAVFVDAKVGAAKAVTVSDYALSGADASNYTLTQPNGFTADITAKEISISGISIDDKIYDGELTAVISGTAILSGVVSGDDVTTAGGTASFTDVNVGTAKAITVSDYTLSGADAANYSLTQPTGFTANITTKELTITGISVDNKVYDGTTTASISGTATLNGIISGEEVIVSGGTATFADATAGTAKTVTVSGYTLAGADASNYSLTQPIGLTANISIADQTISITEISQKDIAVDALSFDAEATTTSGLDLSFSIQSGPATIAGATITLTGETGTVIVEVSQAGNTNYNAATATTSFNVIDNSKQEQTITFEALADKTYGDAAFDLSATASSGLAVSYSVISGNVSIDGNTITITGSGDVTIEATQSGDDSYNPATAVQQSFTIAKAALTVTADDKNISYGDAIPELTYTISGFVNSEDNTALTTQPTASTTATADSDAGSYNITVSGATASNYSFTYENGSLTIAKANQVITIDAIADKDVADAAFEVNASTTSGLDLAYSIVSGPATISGTSISLTAETGTVVVKASQAGNTNYNEASATTSFNVSDASKQDQSITFDEIADKTYGDAAFELTASASSGLDVIFSVISGPATIESAIVTITGAGEVTIEANQAGNETYNPAAAVQQSFTVNKASQTVIIDAIADKSINDAPFDVAASTTSALSLTYSIVSGPATISGTTVTLDGTTGIVTVQAKQAGNENYLADSASVNFEVIAPTKLEQSITFNAIDAKTYGDSFELTASSSLSLEVSYSVVSGSATLDGTSLTLTSAGEVVIEATQAGNDTVEAAAAVQQTITINKASLTITAVDASKNEGDANPEFDMTFDGLVLDDSSDDLDELPTIACEADESSTAGTYDIILSGGSDANYEYTLVNGTLTVNEGTLINAERLFEVSVYPNPTAECLNIMNNSNIEITNIEIYNTTGKLVYARDSFIENINVSALLQGTYIIKINKVKTIMFIKE